MKKLILIFLIPMVVTAQDYGSFVVENTNFKEIFNKYRVASPDKVPWVGSWWAFKRNGTTYNGMYGENSKELGPTQKFDKFFELGSKTTDWEAANNTCDKQTDEKRIESCKGWWGHCNAWAAAAIKEEEPREDFMAESETGETFKMTVADQKAYLTEIYMETNSSFIGKRSNEEDGDWVWNKNHETSKELKNGRYPSHGTKYEAFWDITPKQLFFVFTNYIGIRRLGLVIDRYTGSQVWNQPMAGYRILPILKDDIKEPKEQDGKTVYPVMIKMKMFWAEDGVGELEVSESFDINRTSDEFKYEEHYNKHYSGRSIAFFLFFDKEIKVSKDGKKVKSSGKIVGDGIWYHQSEEGAKDWKSVIVNTHPDFIWMPKAVINKTKKRSRPPVLTEERVRDVFGDKKEIKEEREKLERRIDNINSLAKFKKLQKDILAFRKKGSITDKYMVNVLINLKTNTTPFVKRPDDFLMVVGNGVDKPTKGYKLATSKFIAENMDLFFSLNPNATSILALQDLLMTNSTRGANTINMVLSLKERGLSRTKNPGLFLKMLALGTEKPSKGYKNAVAAFLIGKIDDFMLLSPSVNQVLSFQAILLNVEAGFVVIYKLKEAAIKNISRYQDYVALLDYGTKNPPKEYRQLVYNLAKENPYKNPDTEGLLRVDFSMSFKEYIENHQTIIRRLNYSYNDILNHKKKGLELLTSPYELNELVAPRANPVSIRYQGLVDDFISSNISKMIKKVNPSVTDLMSLHKFISDNTIDLDLKKAALKVLKNENDLFIILNPGKMGASKKYSESISKFMVSNIKLLREKTAPSLEKWMELTQYARTPKAVMAIKQEGINLIKDSNDMGVVLGNGMVGNPNEELEKEFGAFLIKNIKPMIKLGKPTSEQLVSLTSFAKTLDGKMAIKKAGRDQVKTLEDFAYLLDPFEDDPSKEYLSAIEDFKKNNPFKDESGSIVEVTYETCSYQLKTKVIKWNKGTFLGAAYNKGLACNKALEKCTAKKDWQTKCYKDE